MKTAKHIPHIKTFVQPSSPDDNLIDWLVLTSHNLSIAAWGQIQQRSDSYSSDEKVLFIRHWELGVFISPATLAKKMPPDGKDCKIRLVAHPGDQNAVISIDSDGEDEGEADNAVLVPLPYDINPDPYHDNDQAWATDRSYPLPDAFGITM